MKTPHTHHAPGRFAQQGRRRALAGLALGPLALASAWAAKPDPVAPAWPTQPLTLVVGFAKGSVSEVLASVLAEPLAQALGQPIKLEVLVGKAGTLAAAKVAQAADGHTFGIVMGNTLTVARQVDPSLPYEPERDLRGLVLTSDDPMALVAPATEPSATPQQFLATARAAGEGWRFGSQGVGSLGHLAMEYLEVRAGLHPLHQPYTGGPEVVEAMRAGKVQLAMLPATLAKRHTQQGTLKAVALTSYNRSELLPGVPTLHEVGVMGFDYRAWSALVVPRKWPEAQAERLAAAMRRLLEDGAIVQKLAQAGVSVPKDTSAARVRREIAHETRLLGGIAAIQGVKVAPAVASR